MLAHSLHVKLEKQAHAQNKHMHTNIHTHVQDMEPPVTKYYHSFICIEELLAHQDKNKGEIVAVNNQGTHIILYYFVCGRGDIQCYLHSAKVYRRGDEGCHRKFFVV